MDVSRERDHSIFSLHVEITRLQDRILEQLGLNIRRDGLVIDLLTGHRAHPTHKQHWDQHKCKKPQHS